MRRPSIPSWISSSALALLSACAGPGRTASAPADEASPLSANGGAPPALPGTALVVEDMDGNRHELGAGTDSGTVALVFWQTWCASCKREAPDIVAASRQNDDIRFFGVVPGRDEDVDDAEVLQVAQAWGLPYAQIRDRDLALTELFGVTGTPDIVVLDQDGQVRYRGHRPPEDWSSLR